MGHRQPSDSLSLFAVAIDFIGHYVLGNCLTLSFCSFEVGSNFELQLAVSAQLSLQDLKDFYRRCDPWHARNLMMCGAYNELDCLHSRSTQ